MKYLELPISTGKNCTKTQPNRIPNKRQLNSSTSHWTPKPLRSCWAVIESLLGNPKITSKFFAAHPLRLEACQTAENLMCSACETPRMCCNRDAAEKHRNQTTCWLRSSISAVTFALDRGELINMTTQSLLPPGPSLPHPQPWLPADLPKLSLPSPESRRSDAFPWQDWLTAQWPSHTPQPASGALRRTRDCAPWQRPEGRVWKCEISALVAAISSTSHSLWMQSAGWQTHMKNV